MWTTKCNALQPERNETKGLGTLDYEFEKRTKWKRAKYQISFSYQCHSVVRLSVKYIKYKFMLATWTFSKMFFHLFCLFFFGFGITVYKLGIGFI